VYDVVLVNNTCNCDHIVNYLCLDRSISIVSIDTCFFIKAKSQEGFTVLPRNLYRRVKLRSNF